MATVVADLSMSLDGFVADRSDEVGPLFDWFGNGDVTVPMADRTGPFTRPRQARL